MRRIWYLTLIVALLLPVGCTPQAQEMQEAEGLMHLQHAYQQATVALNRPPQNLDELKKHWAEGDRWLTSPRDGQPYVIRWGVSVQDPNLDPAHPPWIAYEQTGKNGIRQGITAMGLSEMTEEEHAKLLPP